jgi:hypothetical protein
MAGRKMAIEARLVFIFLPDIFLRPNHTSNPTVLINSRALLRWTTPGRIL